MSLLSFAARKSNREQHRAGLKVYRREARLFSASVPRNFSRSGGYVQVRSPNGCVCGEISRLFFRVDCFIHGKVN